MSHWGIVTLETTKHVVPCDASGVLLEPLHTPSLQCWCKPKIDGDDPDTIIHNDPERGGYSA